MRFCGIIIAWWAPGRTCVGRASHSLEMGMLGVPARRFEPELLDGPLDDSEELSGNLRDMALANRLLLSNHAVLRRIERWLAAWPADKTATILDVATGAGELPSALARWAARRGRRIRLLASDMNHAIVCIARRTLEPCGASLIRHDALQMPFADQSVEVVTSAFSLHHFAPRAAARLLREMARVARLGVVVSDLRRSYAGYWGARLLALGSANRLSRHDGPLSVLRAYTPDEARAMLDTAGIEGCVRAEPVFRLMVTLEQTSLAP